jgi:outer membrane protein
MTLQPFGLIRRIVLSGLLVLLAMATSPAVGQDPMPLSLEDARTYAIEHNKNLANAGLAVEEAGARLRETIAQGLPQVNATVDYNNFFGSTASLGAFPGMTIEFNPTSNLSVSVGQLIFSGSYIVGIRTARLFREVTETSLEKTELEVRAQVTQAYHLALVSKESRNIIAANLENLSDLQGKTRALVDVGIAEEVDYDQLSVQVSMLNDAVRAADRQVELSLNMLRLQMGMPADREITLTDDLDRIIGRSDFRGSLGRPFSLQENPDFRLMSLQTGLAEKQVQLERTAYLPTLTGFYNFTEKLLKPEFDITPNHVIGLNLSIPIFASGARKHRVDQARINLEVAENQKELLSHQLQIQEKQLRFNLNTALEQYESQLKNMEVARRVYQNFDNKFRQGMISSLDMITANNNYLQAENSYVSALMQLMDAQVALETLLNIQ